VSNVADIAREIDRRLPELARDVIRSHLDVSVPENRSFLQSPDGREQHQTEWHQWGIITHTRRFLRDLETAVPGYLRSWGRWETVDARLQRPIDGATRWQLLEVTILLHDIGKFGARRRGRQRFHFGGHEVLSGEIIRSQLHLDRLGLTETQIEYIARTAEDHFVLGVVRKRAREQGAYDLGFVETSSFRELALDIKDRHPEDFVEIGVLFLGDSLSKADPESGPERAAGQYGVNIAVARHYLEIVLDAGG